MCTENLAGNKNLMGNRVQYDSTNVEKCRHPVQNGCEERCIKNNERTWPHILPRVIFAWWVTGKTCFILLCYFPNFSLLGSVAFDKINVFCKSLANPKGNGVWLIVAHDPEGVTPNWDRRVVKNKLQWKVTLAADSGLSTLPAQGRPPQWVGQTGRCERD